MNEQTKKIKDIENQRFSGSLRNLRFQRDFHGFENKVFKQPKYMLLEKTKSLYTMLQPYLDQFPKNAKFTLRARIENSLLDIIKALIMQNYKHTDYERKEHILDVIANIHLLKVLLQQAVVFQYISYNNYQKVFGLMNEITAIATVRYRNLMREREREMKTYNTLYKEIIALPNLYRAYSEARKGKTDQTFIEFNKNPHENIWELHEELLNQSYEPSPYTIFYVNDYKKRRIMAPHFRDHIVHHAIHNYLEQIYDSTFIHDSFACRKGKGTHKGFKRLKSFVNKRQQNDYFMKCDITKYFYSIDQHKLMNIIKRKITDKKLLWILGKIIDSHKEELLPSHTPNSNYEKQKKGIPIGNLTSQLFANIYLNELDYFIKHKLRIKHYTRYVDDFVILAKDKNYLHKTWQQIQNFLKNQLYLKLEPRKTHINKISFGVDFIGYVAFKRHVRIRTKNYRRFKIRLNDRIHDYYLGNISLENLNASFMSYFGHLSHTNSNKIKEKLYNKYVMVTTSTASLCFGAGTGTMGLMPGPSVPT